MSRLQQGLSKLNSMNGASVRGLSVKVGTVICYDNWFPEISRIR